MLFLRTRGVVFPDVTYLTTALLIIMQVNHLRIFRIFRPLAAMKSKQAPLLLVMRHCRHQRAPLRHLHLPRVKPGWLSLWTSVATLSRHRPPIRPQRLQGRALKLSQRHLQRVDQKLLQNKTSVVSNQTRELPPQRNIFGGRGACGWLQEKSLTKIHGRKRRGSKETAIRP